MSWLILSVLIVLVGCSKTSEARKEVLFEVRAGESTSRIAERLDSLEIISHPRIFVLRAKLTGLDKKLQRGLYRLRTGMGEDSVLAILSEGKIATVQVTIPEGLKLPEIASRLEQAGVASKDSILALCKDRKLILELGIPFSSLEGVLYPDTYYFPVGITPEEALRLMVRRFFEIANPMLSEVQLDTLVILASIVEREAYLDSERPVIASVFLNRLRKSLPLESCATIEYILPRHKERLTYADLRVDSPYNTYLHTGLPPGPICSPGKASLEAVARPAPTEYFFFVSKGDGSHHFSKTASEHERMKQEINSSDNK